MKKAINSNYIMKSSQRNDIFRKFQDLFRFLLNDSLGYDKRFYVRQSSTRYRDEFDVFTNSVSSDVRYFIGYTGSGKSTFIRHYFELDSMSPRIIESKKSIIVPSFWNPKQIIYDPRTEIVGHIVGNLNAAMREINPDRMTVFPINEVDEFTKFISKTKGDILTPLSVDEVMELGGDKIKITAKILSNAQVKQPLDYTCSALRYFIEKYSEINRIIFIIDDVETLSITSLHFLINSYYHIYDYFNNVGEKPITVNLLISLRPHSFRFLKEKSFQHEHIISYGNHLESRCYHIIKNDVPNIRKIFIKRFEYYDKRIEPGNRETWKESKKNLYFLVNRIEDYYIDVLVDLCHMNIRAVFDCLQLILSNRIWCQGDKPPTPYPYVNPRDYRFNDLLNLLRTLSCGENSVYTGLKDQQFNPSDLSEMQPRPRFDGSEVFIPNLINDKNDRKINLIAIYIMYYLENKFSSTDNTPVNTEYIRFDDLLNEIEITLNLQNENKRDEIRNIITELFKNRIVRKSIRDSDNDQTIEYVNGESFLYFTRKGGRLLKLIKENSILLEIYREDIVREYSDDDHCKSSFELVLKQKRDVLFADLIDLAHEIYTAEDDLITKAMQSDNALTTSGFIKDFRLTNDICEGLTNTFITAKGINTDHYVQAVEKLRDEVEIRKAELIT